EDISIDTSGASEVIEKLLGDVPPKTPSFNALTKIKNVILDADGDIVVLDRIKRDTIDEILNKSKTSPTLRREMKIVKDALLNAMDSKSPQYAQARLIHALHSPAIERAEKGITGILANMEGDNIAGAVTQLMASKNTIPETIKKARALIRKQNPEAWDAALRDFIRFKFERIKDSQISDVSNLGGALRKAVFGNQNQRDVMKAAMSPQQFRNLTDFMEVLQKTGLTFAKESATATRQAELRALERETQMEVLTIATSPFRTPERTIADRVNALRFGRGARELAEKILDPEAGAELARIKRLSPRSEDLINSVAVILGVTAPETIEAVQGITNQQAQ
ncbi:hypothetical protein LCGC14_2783300, partial [marine sediment metagenome]